MGRLDEYRRKRDFDRTNEPAGAVAAGPSGRGFVVHKHAARRLHYDLRLEHDGVLLSWALPKGPSLTPGEKRLAVQTEDHPLSYGDFEGTIPAGEYGGGTVMLWDRGQWAPIGDGVREDRIDFELRGEKLRGAWTLTRTGGQRGEDGKDWLLIKRSDRGAPPLEPHDESVLSGRTMEQIAAGTEAAVVPAPVDAAELAGARRADLGAGAEVQLASLASEPPAGADWIHEIKFDGYRVVARIEDGEARLFTRNGHDWSDRFPEIAAALRPFPARRALLDGEVVAMGPGGVSSFERLQEALSSGATGALRYQAFDLLHLEDHDLRGAPQLERKRALAALLEAAAGSLGALVRYTDHVQGKGPAFFARACRHGLEGIISKRADAPYRGGRGTRWRKVKCGRRDEFVVGGYTAPQGSRTGFGALLLGAFDGDALAYAGRVGTGFDERGLRRLHAALQQIERPTPPFAAVPREVRAATWVEPELVVEVAFTERTRDGRLRHPTFRGLREDKPAAEVTWPPQDAAAREVPAAQGAGAKAKAPAAASAAEGPAAASGSGKARGGDPPPRRRSARARKGDAEVAGVRLSNPDRVLYPSQGITKLALAEYYLAIEAHVLPALSERPLALVRCPQGRAKTCFYQKHPGDAFPRDLPRVAIEEKSGSKEYAYVRTIADLLGLVQAGVLEVHVWGSRIDQVERPDLMVIDLDPSPDVPWAITRATAREVRGRLANLGLTGFLRATGGKGLHVVVPLQRRHGWDEVKSFARALCERLAAADPERLTTSSSMAKRPGKIYLDFLRNGRGATAIGSYSTRAREGAPVAVPVRWDELDRGLRPDQYSVGNVRRRLASLRDDPWEGFDAAAGRITAAMRKEVGLR
jgi:bifunctional non-homologous end joining protein LigD